MINYPRSWFVLPHVSNHFLLHPQPPSTLHDLPSLQLQACLCTTGNGTRAYTQQTSRVKEAAGLNADKNMATQPVVKQLVKATGAENYNVLQNNGRIAHQEVDHVCSPSPVLFL